MKNYDITSTSVLDSHDINDPNSILHSSVNESIIDGGQSKSGGSANNRNIFIETAYWINNPTQKSKINYLPYKSDDKAYLLVKFIKIAIGKKINIKIFDLDDINDDQLLEFTNNITNEIMIFTFNINGDVFIKGYDSILKLYVKLKVSNIEESYCKNSEELLQVSVVRYIPKIMSANKLHVGATLQKNWFNMDSNSDYKSKIDFNTIKINYFLQFDRFKDFIEKAKKPNKWLTDNSKKLFIERLNKNIISGKYNLPQKLGDLMNFGIDSKRYTFNEAGIKIPEFEANYIQYIVYEESSFSPIDDLFCSLATFQLKVIPFGKISYIDENNYLISIEKIAFYLDDDYNFAGDEFLGFWSPSHNRINKIDPENNSFYKINDSDYRKYRNSTKHGGDFRIFSDFYYTKVEESISVSSNFDTKVKKKLLTL